MTALLDTGQIATLTGLSRAYVTDKLTKHPTFPRPAFNNSQRLRKWKESEVLAWLRDERRSPQQTHGSTSAATA